MSHDELLERLRQDAGLMYVSDLRFSQNRGRVRWALSQLPVQECTLQDWSYILSYIFEKPVSFQTEDGLKKFLERKIR